MLCIEGLTAGYGRIIALHGISLTVCAGQIVCLLGANGAGKTTTLNCISGLIQARAGRITFAGETLCGLDPAAIVACGIVQVPERRAVFRSMCVRDNIELGAWHRRDHAAVRRDFERMMEIFPPMRARLRQAAGMLSGGEQQMLMIARALLAGPRLLLLDEPSLGLSPVMIETIFDAVLRLHETGLAILLVEQNARLALAHSQQGYVLESGEVVAQGSAAQLAADDAVRSAYLGR